jgi:type VI secretion system protein ImpM
MSRPETPQECAGWFGKIPTLGDFVQRNLPESFVAPWDAWLSEELSQAQLVLTDDWSQTWQRVPMWYFALGAGIIDEHGWQGVLVPSVDRVGREFPLTIALSQGRHTAARGAEWWGAMGELAQCAIGPDGGADFLDEALAAFCSEPAALGRDHGRCACAAQPDRETPGEGMSSWWRADVGERREAAALLFAGLPRGEGFRLLLQRSSAG